MRGLRQRLPELDIVTARAMGLAAVSDDELLEAAAGLGRVVLSHDARTLPAAAHSRLANALPVAPVVICPRRLPLGPTIDDLGLLFAARLEDEAWDPVTWLPLR